MLEYPIRLKKDGRTVLATSPDFPELTTFGEDVEDALMHALDALEEAIAARREHKEHVPTPSARDMYHVTLPAQKARKVLLYKDKAG